MQILEDHQITGLVKNVDLDLEVDWGSGLCILNKDLEFFLLHENFLLLQMDILGVRIGRWGQKLGG